MPRTLVLFAHDLEHIVASKFGRKVGRHKCVISIIARRRDQGRIADQLKALFGGLRENIPRKRLDPARAARKLP